MFPAELSSWSLAAMSATVPGGGFCRCDPGGCLSFEEPQSPVCCCCIPWSWRATSVVIGLLPECGCAFWLTKKCHAVIRSSVDGFVAPTYWAPDANVNFFNESKFVASSCPRSNQHYRSYLVLYYDSSLVFLHYLCWHRCYNPRRSHSYCPLLFPVSTDYIWIKSSNLNRFFAPLVHSTKVFCGGTCTFYGFVLFRIMHMVFKCYCINFLILIFIYFIL